MLVYKLNIYHPVEIIHELSLQDCDPQGIKIMQDKLSYLTVKITDIAGYCALALKEEALSCGAECAIPKKTIRNPGKNCDILLLATIKQLKNIIDKTKKQAFEQLRELSHRLIKFIAEDKIKEPTIMGILNVTPDSFSDGGLFNSIETAVKQAKKMIKEGAKIIDIGGESTRPGAVEISTQEEIKRTIPVIKAIRKFNKKISISIDTTKSRVAEAAVKNGANIINDISGLTRDIKIAGIAAKYKTRLILMHRLGPSKIMQKDPKYQDILKEILTSLQNSIDIALNTGVNRENIIIDPGIGFGKTTEHNLYLIKHLCAFKSLGYPVLLGTSRKSVIGNILKNQPLERLSGTLAANLMGQLNNVDYLRVHDVKENREAVQMFTALLNA